MNDLELRNNLIATAIALNTSGINQGTSGNVSVRTETGFLITPSGMQYAELEPSDVVLMDFNGGFDSDRKPSSEWRFHLDIYRHSDDEEKNNGEGKDGNSEYKVGAIVHTHSTYATAIACLKRCIPAFHYMVAVAGGHDIRCAPYATFGSQELSDYAIEALVDRKACLLAHHGVIATGANLAKAFALAGEVETLAHQYLEALKVGQPETLSRDEMDRVVEKFKTYGAQAQQKRGARQ